MIKKNLLILLLSLASFGLQAQKLTVYDQVTQSPIQGAELLVDGISTGLLSNTEGIIILNLADEVEIFGFFALGYQAIMFKKTALNTLKAVYLKPLAYNLRELAVVASTKVPIRTEVGVIQLDAQHISKLPTVFAEPDMLKAMQLLPGVSSVLENNVGLYVRGGKADHSLITIDGDTIYNPAHSFGLFSVVHPSSVSSTSSSTTLYKEAFTGQMGSRSSAFLDVQLKEGNYNKWQGALGIGLISSHLEVQGPLSKGKVPVSLQFVGRTTYIDRILNIISFGEQLTNTGFDDFSVKLSSKLNDHKKLTFTYYQSHDYFKVRLEGLNILPTNNDWKNRIVSMKLNNSKSQKWLKSSNATFSQYELNNYFSDFVHSSSLNDFGFNHNYKAFNPNQLITQIGIQSTLHFVNPGKMTIVDSPSFELNPYNIGTQTFVEIAPYIDFHKKLKNNYEAKASLRFSNYISSNLVSIYPEPRLQLAKKYRRSTVALSYDRLSQFMQLYSSNVTPLPTDAWFISTKNIRPIVSNSISFSYNKSGYENKYSLNSSLYYRHFTNVSDIRGGASALIDLNYENLIRTGNNNSYGFEVLLQKKRVHLQAG